MFGLIQRGRKTTSVTRRPCRSGATPDNEVRCDQDRGSVGPSGDAPRARAAGEPAHRHHQPDPCAFLLERGVAVRQGLRFLRSELPGILAGPSDALSPRMVHLLEDLAGDWRRLDERIEGLSNEIEVIADQDAGCDRLISVPGVGPIISSAIVAAIAQRDVFSSGRDFAAWLGLVPMQISPGARTTLGNIAKRGNRYPRGLCVPAARV